MPGLIMKRSREEMEAGSRGPGPALQNPESTDGETPRKKQMTENAVNGLHQLTTQEEVAKASMPDGVRARSAQPEHPTHSLGIIQHVPNSLPPEIERVPLESYVPMALLIERLAQNTFENLHDTIDELAETSQIHVNGAGAAAAQEANTERKKRLWNFAQDSRAKFVKLLVLSQWSRNAESIARVIDINLYLMKQKTNYDQAHRWVGALKSVLAPHNVPAPDLTATLRSLAEGKAEWISDLGYIPKPVLTAQETLKFLRRVNTLLAIRLGLHQRPSERLRDYEIHDGRVTFRVKDEFELDLSVGSEDHNEQLYFLDLRFIFKTGGGRLRGDRVRDEVERRVNYVLRAKGLDECYVFLHDLTLTHKLSIFRLQARQLAMSHWVDNAKPEIVHRALVLQYWVKRPGGKHQKNWIEIGIRKRCTPDEILSGAPDIPHLSVRWHRHGKEVMDHGLEVDPSDVCLEAVLKDTLAAHTNYIFSSIKKDLLKNEKKMLGQVFRIKHRQSPLEPADCALDITFPDGQVVTMVMEPVSGRLALMPPSKILIRFENKLNGLLDPATQAAEVIRQLRAATAAERSRRQIAMIGWTQVPIPRLGPQTLQSSFLSKDVYRVQYCRPLHWDKQWCLALSHHTSGCEIWHLMKMKDDPNAPLSRDEVLLGREKSPFRTSIMLCYDPSGGVANGAMAVSSLRMWNIQSSDALQHTITATAESYNNLGTPPSHKYNFLLSLAAHGAAIISQLVNGGQLGKYQKEQKLSEIFTWEHSDPSLDLKAIVPRDDGKPDTMHKTCVSGIRIRLWRAELVKCYKEDVKVYVAGVYSGDGRIVMVSHAELVRPLPMSTETLRFPGGAFQVDRRNPCRLAVQLSIKAGDIFVTRLFECLLSFSKMMIAADSLQKFSLDVKRIELGRIEASLEGLNSAVVSRDHPLRPEQLSIVFSSRRSGGFIGINTLEFARGSPYARAAADWVNLLSERGISVVAARLQLAYPFMAAVAELSKQSFSTRPFLYQSTTMSVQLMWGREGVGHIGVDAKLSKLSSGQPVWRARLVKVLKDNQKAPLAITHADEAWKAHVAYKRGDGCWGMGEEVQIEPTQASAAVWHIFDALKPSIEELYGTAREGNTQQATVREGDEKSGTDKNGASKSETITIE